MSLGCGIGFSELYCWKQIEGNVNVRSLTEGIAGNRVSQKLRGKRK